MNQKHDLTLFRFSIIWLEKYIEQSQFFLDWEQRKQTDTSQIKWVNSQTPASEVLKTLGTQLHIGFAYIGEGKDRKSPEFRETVKSEFYKWINATKIDNNCPKELKLVLFTMHEIFKDKENGYKLHKSAENSVKELDPNSPEYQKQLQEVFSSISEAHANGEAFKVNSDRFNGNAQAGKVVFEEIANSLSASEKENFHFWPQESDQEKVKENQKQVGEEKLAPYFSNQTVPKKEPKTPLFAIIFIISIFVSLGLILALVFYPRKKKNEPRK